MKKAEITKNKIISAALKILREKGSLTVKEISDEAGVNIAAINYHFNDKSNLLRVVLHRVGGDLRGKMETMLSVSPQTKDEMVFSITRFSDDIFAYAEENALVLKFFFDPSDAELVAETTKMFSSLFTIDSEYAYRITARLSDFSPEASAADLKVKYLMLFSAIALPVIFRFGLTPFGTKNMYSFEDISMRRRYIDHITRAVLV